MFTLKIDDIACIYRDKLIVIVVDKNEHRFLYNKNLSDLETELDPGLFFRANRQYLININFIKNYTIIDRVKLAVRLKLPSNRHQIIISQETAPLFKKWIRDEN
jgi:DNA-binding LytR/AlgR family response regulator